MFHLFIRDTDEDAFNICISELNFKKFTHDTKKNDNLRLVANCVLELNPRSGNSVGKTY